MNQFGRLAALALSCVTMATALSPTAYAYQHYNEIPVSGTQNRAHNFHKDFTLTGNYADDLVNVAQSQLGLTTKEAQYSEDWCANFVADCARLTEMPNDIIPYDYSLVAGCRFFYSYILESCGATVISDENDVMSGDLVFYYCPSSDFYLHVAIVESSNNYLEGNITTAKGREEVIRSKFNYKFGCYIHNDKVDTTLSGHVERLYVRPNYGRPPVKLYTDTDPASYYPPERVLSYKEPIPSCGFDVCWVQTILKSLGYSDTVNGIYDETTRDAIARFQIENNLYSDGITESETINALKTCYQDLYKPSFISFSTKDSFTYDSQISFDIDGSNYDSAKIVITDINGTILYSNNDFSTESSLPANLLGKGTFTANCTLENKYGESSTLSTTLIVTDPLPETPDLIIDYKNTTPAVFSWNPTVNTTAYDLYITDSKGNTYNTITNISDCSHTVFLAAGRYSAYLIAKNETVSNQSNSIRFITNNLTSAFSDEEFYAKLYNDDLCLATGNSLLLKKNSNLSSFKWHFIKQEDNTYTIINCKTKQAIMVGNNSSVILSSPTTTILQKWIPVNTMEGIIFVSAYDKSKVLTFTNNEPQINRSKDCKTEAFRLETIDTPHRFILTEICKPKENTDGYANYICDITGETTSSSITYHTPDTPDKPNTNSNDIPDKPIRLVGDVNCDGKVTNIDSLILLRSVIGLYNLDEISHILHDTNNDKRITSVDSMKILQYVVGIENDSSVGNKVMIK